jgi:adenosylcobyric acid synthase
MVQGTASSAGKSLLTTALCAYAARAGITVAPFKAQNMSNNARVVHGGEIGTAQALQAWAAGVAADVRMNPILVKPEGDTRSQVVRLDQVDGRLSGMRWEHRAEALWGDIATSLHSLLDEYELVIIAGAGSPAEFNLWPYDLANMRVAAEADAPVLVVSDIDRGGALAHCYGTWAVLPATQRSHSIRPSVARSTTRTMASVTSGPMPSPGMRVIG